MQELFALSCIGVAIMYGGGQIPEANYIIGSFIRELTTIPTIVLYGIHMSFMGMADSYKYEPLTPKKARKIQRQIGTYLETCRDFQPYSEENFYRILDNLKRYNIHVIFVPGGDGSAVATKKFRDKCREVGYPILIIWIPSTIDGINGSQTIGILAAVEESVRRVTAMAVNAFATWDNGKIGPRVAIIEIQGRNRNDIAVETIRRLKKTGYFGKYKLSEVNLIFLPTGYKWSTRQLMTNILESSKPTVIIASEGAKPKTGRWKNIQGKNVATKIGNLINSTEIKKANVDIIGYLSQTNTFLSANDKKLIDRWIKKAVEEFLTEQEDDFSCIGIIMQNGKYEAVPIEYITDQNTSKNPIPLTKNEIEELKEFLM